MKNRLFTQRPGFVFRSLACVLACAGVTTVSAGSLQVTVLDKDGKPTPDAVVIVLPAVKAVAKNPPPMLAIINQASAQSKITRRFSVGAADHPTDGLHP